MSKNSDASLNSSQSEGKGFFDNNCDEISYRYRSSLLSSGAEHSQILYTIQYHNEDRKDNITFNAQEILDSQLVSDLNPAYFVPMTR